MRNDINYSILLSLTPTPTPEKIIKILIRLDFESVAGLSRKILTSHTAINRVLAGENLPEVRKEILAALEMTIVPFQ